MVCAGSACVCACRRVSGVARGKPQSHRASKGKGSPRMASLSHGTPKGPLLVALGGVQAPRCGWEPGGCMHILTEVSQDTGKEWGYLLGQWPLSFSRSFGCLCSDQLPHLGQSWEEEMLQGAVSNVPTLPGTPCLSCTTATCLLIPNGLRLTSGPTVSPALLSEPGQGCGTDLTACLSPMSPPLDAPMEHPSLPQRAWLTLVSHLLLPLGRKPNVWVKQEPRFTPKRSHRQAPEIPKRPAMASKLSTLPSMIVLSAQTVPLPDFPLLCLPVVRGHLVPVKIPGVKNSRFFSFFLTSFLDRTVPFAYEIFPKH